MCEMLSDVDHFHQIAITLYLQQLEMQFFLLVPSSKLFSLKFKFISFVFLL